MCVCVCVYVYAHCILLLYTYLCADMYFGKEVYIVQYVSTYVMQVTSCKR